MLTVDANIWVAAFDHHDRFHAASTNFLRTVARDELALHGPAFLTLEVGCALARRTRDAAIGREVDQRLRTHPALALHAMDDLLLETARQAGIQQLLRGSDALYVAVSRLQRTPLISWDDELATRAGALTPDSWLAAR